MSIADSGAKVPAQLLWGPSIGGFHHIFRFPFWVSQPHARMSCISFLVRFMSTNVWNFLQFIIGVDRDGWRHGQFLLKTFVNFERTFWYPRTLIKTNERSRHSTVRQKNRFRLFVFLEESSAWKNHYDFVWPLFESTCWNPA